MDGYLHDEQRKVFEEGSKELAFENINHAPHSAAITSDCAIAWGLLSKSSFTDFLIKFTPNLLSDFDSELSSIAINNYPQNIISIFSSNSLFALFLRLLI